MYKHRPVDGLCGAVAADGVEQHAAQARTQRRGKHHLVAKVCEAQLKDGLQALARHVVVVLARSAAARMWAGRGCSQK